MDLVVVVHIHRSEISKKVNSFPNWPSLSCLKKTDQRRNSLDERSHQKKQWREQDERAALATISIIL